MPQPNNNYVVYASYQGPDDSGAKQAWILPPAFSFGQASPPTPLNLPNLWTGQGDPARLTLRNDDFVLAVSYNNPPKPSSVTVTLQMTGKNLWLTQPAARATLRNNFLAFIAKVETSFELASTPLLVSGATSFIASTLLQYMPLPLSDVLLYACGLETGIGTGVSASVDLLPGMRLRTEPSVRQYVAPPNQAFSGYVSAGTLEWDVSTNTSNGATVQAFNAFLGTIAAPQITPPPPSPSPVFGLIDLQQNGNGFRHHRLVYPQNIIDASLPGSSSPATNVQITGANTLAELRATPSIKSVFFGRDTVIPEIAILLQLGNNVNPVPMYVSVGTTVMNMLERFTTWLPRAYAQQVVQLQRLALNTTSGTRGAQQYVSVQFADPNAQVNQVGAFRLPLLPGDYLTIALGQ